MSVFIIRQIFLSHLKPLKIREVEFKQERSDLIRKIFSCTVDDFDQIALEVFRYQYNFNAIYHKYVLQLNVDFNKIDAVNKIPFLPIEFFKSFVVLTGFQNAETIFSSSGTTGSETSKHFVPEIELYQTSFRKGFENFYGAMEDYCFLALLPSYLERDGSSLIYMANDMIQTGHSELSGFYLHHSEELVRTLTTVKEKGQKTILLGVTFALLDFVKEHRIDFPDLIVMETGGMKGRRQEIIREEVHRELCKGFGVAKIHSEYGMTELLSQAYSQNDGLFFTPPWMKIMMRDTNDPFSLVQNGMTGGINVIDLANLDSCAFLATQDLGKIYNDGGFEVLGRFDYSDVRGCNLLVI